MAPFSSLVLRFFAYPPTQSVKGNELFIAVIRTCLDFLLVLFILLVLFGLLSPSITVGHERRLCGINICNQRTYTGHGYDYFVDEQFRSLSSATASA